jgi:hypothetical protein
MLPAPKRALPVSAGGKGGLIGERKPMVVPKKQLAADADSDDEPAHVPATTSSKTKGKLSAPAVDLFGLGKLQSLLTTAYF